MRLLPSRSLNYDCPHNNFMNFERRTVHEEPVPNESFRPNIPLPDWVKAGNRAYLKTIPSVKRIKSLSLFLL